MSKLDELKNKIGSSNSKFSNIQVPNLVGNAQNTKLVSTNADLLTSLKQNINLQCTLQEQAKIKTEIAKKIVNSRSKKQYEILYLIDASGSCAPYVDSTVIGYNDFINTQKSTNRNVVITTTVFEEKYYDLETRTNINNARSLDYNAGGGTGLYDALCNKIISTMDAQDKYDIKPDHTLVVITTDGEDTTSIQYNLNDTRRIISQAKERGWDFIFLGAFKLEEKLIDYARKLGLDEKNVSLYLPEYTQDNFRAVNEAINSLELDSEIGEDWKKHIRKQKKSIEQKSTDQKVLTIGKK